MMQTKTKRLIWGLILGVVAAAAAVSSGVAVLAGCTTLQDGTTAPDWDKIDVAGDELIRFLDREYESWGLVDPEVAGDIARVRDVVKQLDAAVDAVIAGEGAGDFDRYLLTAVALVDEMSSRGGSPAYMETMRSLRDLLGLVRVLAA